MKIKTKYDLKETIELISESTCRFPILTKPYFYPPLIAQIYGNIDENGFELRDSLEYFRSLRACGKFLSSDEGTIIEIEFKKPPHPNIALSNPSKRWNHDRKKFLEFLCKTLDVTDFQSDNEIEESELESIVNDGREALVYPKSGHPEPNLEEFNSKQAALCSDLAGLVIDRIPNNWDNATLEISFGAKESKFIFSNSKYGKKNFPPSNDIVQKARELHGLFHDMGKSWKKAILSLSWNARHKGWHMAMDYQYE